MMSSIFLRRSAALSASKIRVSAALFSPIANSFPSPAEVSGSISASDYRGFSISDVSERPSGFSFQSKRFHASSGPLNFKSTLISQAEFAVEDYDDASSSNSGDEGLEIGKLGIAPEIVSALEKKGISKLFPIQKAVLEPAMQGRDMIGRARTGTGKTLAFGIPILDKIIQYNAKHGRGRFPLALVLAPTRELAKQVEKEFHDASPSLDTVCVYGGTPISSQMRQLEYGVDIVVGTPGRLIDLLNRGSLNLSEVQFIVLDEADQMLQVGFQEDVEKILERLPKKRQTMMFSATMPSWIRKLTQNYLSNPLTIDLVGDSDQKLADGISLFSILEDKHGRASILGPLITEHAKGGKCIIFTQTKRDADRLAYAMARKFKCEALHGDISQSQRERTLSGFRDGQFNILVATDVASRGLDIPNVDLVIHYELPNNTEIFVHRSGRTGRAGKKGRAILMYTQDQARAVKIIEREVGCRFSELPKITVEGAPVDMFSDRGGGGQFGSFGGSRDRDSGRFGGQRGGFGRSGGYGSSGSYGNSGSSRSSGFKDSFGQMGRNGGSSTGGFGSYGGRSSGESGSSYGGSRSGGFGSYGGRSSGESGSSYGGSRSGGFGSSGGSKSGGFTSFGGGSDRRSGFGNSSKNSGFFGGD